MRVTVGETNVAVGDTSVTVGGTGVTVGGTSVAVGETSVATAFAIVTVDGTSVTADYKSVTVGDMSVTVDKTNPMTLSSAVGSTAGFVLLLVWLECNRRRGEIACRTFGVGRRFPSLFSMEVVKKG